MLKRVMHFKIIFGIITGREMHSAYALQVQCLRGGGGGLSGD